MIQVHITKKTFDAYTLPHYFITSVFFKSIMLSEDHKHEARESSDDFSLDPDALDTTPFRSYGRGFPNVPLMR